MSSRFEQLLNEKFGFTVDLPKNEQPTPARMHDDVTDRNGRGSYVAGGHPMEKYRDHVKAMLGALDTETESILEGAIDWVALKRLADKHGLKSTFTDALDVIKAESEKGKKADIKKIREEFEKIKDSIPYWFLGNAAPKSGDEPKKIPEDEKKELTNLLDIAEKIREHSGKEFRRAAEGTPDHTKKSQAEKNLDKARKEAGIKKVEDKNKKPENEIGPKK